PRQSQRAGPLALSLRKLDNKRARYNIEILLGDDRISKTDLRLYEPLVFYPEGSPRALEVVVNHIDRDSVHGYVSAPKYSQLASVDAPAGDVRTSRPSDSPEQARLTQKQPGASKSAISSSASGDQ